MIHRGASKMKKKEKNIQNTKHLLFFSLATQKRKDLNRTMNRMK